MNSKTCVIGISYVGGPEFLKKAIASVPLEHQQDIAVVNSSEPRSIQSNGQLWNEYFPPVPLSHTQSHNYFQAMAGLSDALIVMHADAEVEPDTIDRLLGMIDGLPPKWGVVFTNYDAVAMYNPAMWQDIGGWDWRLFPSYYSDNDYYRRATLAGWKLIESNLPVKHFGSHIINAVDKRLRYLNHTLLHNQAREAYIKKWNGDPGNETYIKPFNGELENPYPDV